MNKQIPKVFRQYLGTRRVSLFDEGQGRQGVSFRGFWVGTFLSFLLAVGAPYGNMIIRGSYMALDFSTPGAIFLFFVLIAVLNVAFKWTARRLEYALGLAAVVAVWWLWTYWPFDAIDVHAPGFMVGTFVAVTLILNVGLVASGRSWALNRSELVLVYVMLIIVSALCTMGLSEQILPMLTALFYFASPQNKWVEKLLPHRPHQSILVDDGQQNAPFYEGLTGDGQVPYEAWVEPLMWWAVFLLALYACMVSVAVILRRQWMERERLSYPIAQVGLAMVRGEREGQLVNDFLRQPSMWIGCAIPLFIGSMKALHAYFPSVPVIGLSWTVGFVGKQSLRLVISWAMLGFSYLINANIAAGIWVFHLFSKIEKEVFIQMGIKADQKVVYGVNDFPFLAYQGVGALLMMVLIGLWIARHHLRDVFLKAIGRAPEVYDGDEILSYRAAVIGALGGMAVMSLWLYVMGTPLWVAAVFVVLAILIFIGMTRIVVEGGVAAVRSPMTAPDLMIQGMGSGLVGGTGVFNLSLAYIWAADVRVFVMANCANALKMIEEMDPRSRRVVSWGIFLAVLIGSLGAFWMIFHMAYRHGGINLNSWFFKGAPAAALDNILRNVDAKGVFWPGWGFFGAGGGLMAALMLARQRLAWWPLHPIGFPIGANSMLNHIWFSVFLAWAIKRLILRYGGAGLYGRSQAFFLGLIVGQMLCNGLWLCIDYFTGKVGNSIFWV